MKKLLVAVALGLVVLPVVVGAVGEEEEVDGLKSQRAALMMENRDERQAEVVARLVTRMGSLNSRRVAAMNLHLERMRALMTKVRAARDKAVGQGKDVTQVNTAIAAADAAIAVVQTAVDAQGAKTYPANSRTELMTAKKNLLSDLRAVHGSLKSARKAVALAISSLAKVRGEVAPTVTP